MKQFNSENANTLKAIKRYKNLKAQKDAIDAELDKLKAEIVAAMGGDTKATAKIGGVVLTVSNTMITSTRLDTKKVKELYPAIVAECSTTSTSPRFSIK